MKLEMSNDEIRKYQSGNNSSFIKYSTQLMNLANQYSQATRHGNVGQLSELIQEFQGGTLEEWKEWYSEKYPDAIKTAAGKVYIMLQNFKKTIAKLKAEDIERWIEDLVVVKTYTGLNFQEAILAKLSKHYNQPYRLATPDEESKGIDGFVGDDPYSIKPATYKNMKRLKEKITATMVYYTKTEDGLTIEYIKKAPEKKKAPAKKAAVKVKTQAAKTQKAKAAKPKGKRK